VKTRFLPLRRVTLDLALDNGVLVARPLTFSLPRGDITGAVRIDARSDTPDVDIDMTLAGARVEDVLARSGRAGAVAGPLQGRAKLRGRGLSVREAAANADGEVAFVVRNGEIREAFAELLGINVTRGLGLLVSGDKSSIPVRCAVAGFDARDGVLHSRAIVIDTGTVLALGKGTVDLRSERIDIALKGKPKEPRLVRLMAPIQVKGTLARPGVGVDLEGAAGQAGPATAFATLLAPLATIVPFLAVDLAEDADLRRGRAPGARRVNAQNMTKNAP
jgi:hypothetical protein